MKNWLPKFSSKFAEKHGLFESGQSRKYYSGDGTFRASLERSGAVRDGSGNVRGYWSGGRFRKS